MWTLVDASSQLLRERVLTAGRIMLSANGDGSTAFSKGRPHERIRHPPRLVARAGGGYHEPFAGLLFANRHPLLRP